MALNAVSWALREFFRGVFGIDEAMGNRLEVLVDQEGAAHVEIQKRARGYAPTVQCEVTLTKKTEDKT